LESSLRQVDKFCLQERSGRKDGREKWWDRSVNPRGDFQPKRSVSEAGHDGPARVSRQASAICAAMRLSTDVAESRSWATPESPSLPDIQGDSGSNRLRRSHSAATNGGGSWARTSCHHCRYSWGLRHSGTNCRYRWGDTRAGSHMAAAVWRKHSQCRVHLGPHWSRKGSTANVVQVDSLLGRSVNFFFIQRAVGNFVRNMPGGQFQSGDVTNGTRYLVVPTGKLHLNKWCWLTWVAQLTDSLRFSQDRVGLPLCRRHCQLPEGPDVGSESDQLWLGHQMLRD